MAGIRAGNYAIGSGGDYETWSSFVAAIDPFISGQIVGTQISDITETGVVSFNGKTYIEGVWNGVLCNAGITLNSNSPHYGNPQNGWRTTFSGNGHHGFHIHSTGTYHLTPTLNGLNIVAASGISSSGYSLIYATRVNGNTTYPTITNCIINGNHSLINGIDVSGIYFGSRSFNNVIINCSGAGFKYTDCGDLSSQGGGIFSNNTLALNAIGFYDDSENHGDYFLFANAVIANRTDFYKNPSKAGGFPVERNASSDGTSPSGNNPTFNISLNDIISFDETSNDFLRTASGTVLATSGYLTYYNGSYPSFTNGVIAASGIRNNTRPYASGLASIGADEFSPSGSSTPEVGPTVFISKPGFCWGTVPVDIDVIYSENMTNFDLSKISATNASITDMGWLIGSSRRRLRLTPYGTGSLSINIQGNSAKSIATEAWANGYGPVIMSWYATDPTVPGDSTYSSGIYTPGGPEVTIYGFPAYKVPGEAFTVYVQFDTGVYAFNASELSTEFMIENGSHSSGVMVQSNPTRWMFTVTPDNNQLPLNMWIPAGVCQDTETYLVNNVSPLYTLTVEPPPYPTLTVPTSRHDYIYANQPYTIGISFTSVVSGFIASDIIITNANVTSLAGGTSGNYTAVITPSGGGSPILYQIPASVCVGVNSHQNNISSDIYSTEYQFSTSPSNAGGGNNGSGGIGGGIGNWGSGQPGGGAMNPTSSGEFTAVYLDAFTHNGSVVQLVHFPGIANTASGYTDGLGWIYDPVYGWVVDEDFVPSGTNQVSPYPIGWANAIPGTGYMYGSGYFTPNYASGVPYISYAFLDFTQQNLDITYSVKKALNKNQIYASDIEKGHIYLPPNIFLTMGEHEVHVTSDGNQWAKSWDLVVRDVWIILYNDFMWHLVMPKPRYIGNDLVCIETDIVKCGLGYNPWSFIYQKGTAHPLDVSLSVRGHAVGGFTWPVDGGLY